MAIPSSWKSKEEIPERYLPFLESGDIVEKDGVFNLEVTGMRPKKELDGFRKKTIDTLRQLEELQKSTEGGISSDKKEEMETQIEALRDQIAAGPDDKKVAKLVKDRMTTVEVGGREITVLRTDGPALVASLKKSGVDYATASASLVTVNTELAKERVEGGARSAMTKIGGFKPLAQEGVVEHVSLRFKMGADHQPFLPDPEAPPPKNGEMPAALADADGANVSIEGYLRGVVEAGTYAGVWTDDPSGPPKTVKPGHLKAKGDTVSNTSRIARGMEKRAAGAT